MVVGPFHGTSEGRVLNMRIARLRGGHRPAQPLRATQVAFGNRLQPKLSCGASMRLWGRGRRWAGGAGPGVIRAIDVNDALLRIEIDLRQLLRGEAVHAS